jgi:hypothetical protein
MFERRTDDLSVRSMRDADSQTGLFTHGFSNRESQRDSATKAKVARDELPWVNGVFAFLSRNAVAHLSTAHRTKPSSNLVTLR